MIANDRSAVRLALAQLDVEPNRPDISTRAFGFDYHEPRVQPLFARRYAELKALALRTE